MLRTKSNIYKSPGEQFLFVHSTLFPFGLPHDLRKIKVYETKLNIGYSNGPVFRYENFLQPEIFMPENHGPFGKCIPCMR